MKYAIVGGGVGGLTVALELKKRGHEVVVLEREARIGGKCGTQKEGDWQVELGPAGVLDNVVETQSLFSQLGLEVIASDDQARHRFIFLRGKLRQLPSSPPKLLTTRTLSLVDKWRIFREPWAPARAREDETIAEFARRRLGAKITERFVEPAVQGIFAGDIERLSLRACFPRLAALEDEHGSILRGFVAAERGRPKGERHAAKLTTLRGGMGALPIALGKQLEGCVLTSVQAKALERRGGEWVIHGNAGDILAQRVVLAAPPHDAAELLAPVDGRMSDAYGAIRVGGIAAVSLGYSRVEMMHPLGGFGFLVPRVETHRPLGAIWMSSTFPEAHMAPDGHVLVRYLFGGDRDPEAIALSDAQLADAAIEASKNMLGTSAAPRFRHVVRWHRGIPQYDVGHLARVKLIEARGRAIGVLGAGAALRGVGINDLVVDAVQLVKQLEE